MQADNQHPKPISERRSPIARPSREMLAGGYARYINLLRSHRALPSLSVDDLWFNWEAFDVSGLMTPRVPS
jgi:hypothetical protein